MLFIKNGTPSENFGKKETTVPSSKKQANKEINVNKKLTTICSLHGLKLITEFIFRLLLFGKLENN